MSSIIGNLETDAHVEINGVIYEVVSREDFAEIFDKPYPAEDGDRGAMFDKNGSHYFVAWG